MPDAPHHLLVIDDEPFIARIVRTAFERGPFRVSSVLEGRSGLEFLAANRDVALVLLDLNMPGMTGVEMLAALRQDPALRDTVVMVLTAAGQAGQVERARDLGAAAIVTKPFSPKKLYRLVAEHLGENPEAPEA